DVVGGAGDAAVVGDGELGDRRLDEGVTAGQRVDAADAVAGALGEPEVVVGADGEVKRAAAGRQGELGDLAGEGDAGDAAGVELGEPVVAVRSGDDPRGRGACGEAGGEEGDAGVGRQAVFESLQVQAGARGEGVPAS